MRRISACCNSACRLHADAMRTLACLLLVIVSCVRPALAQEMPPTVQKVFDALAKSVDCNWQRTPLIDVLAGLSKSENLTIQLDPAIADRGTRSVTLHAANTSLGAVLERLGGRFALDTRISNTGVVLLVASPGAKPVPEWVDDALPVRKFLPTGQYFRLPPPNGWDDPIPALDDTDRANLLKPSGSTWSKLLEGHIDRIETWHVANSSPPAGLITFLKANPNVRREFWRALDTRFDDAKNACRIVDELRTPDEKLFLANYQVAIAIAVVYDSPPATVSSRYNALWAVRESQFGPTLTYQEIWNYFTDPKRQSQFIFKPKMLPWPVLVQLVDLDVSQAEIDWALAQYGGKKVDLLALYSSVPYDNAKLAHAATKLGDQPYTLENLRRFGGVCVDQAHFSSRIAKIFGVPSLKCCGNGRYGGVGHCWSGYLTAKGKSPELAFTGRYQGDCYYFGTAFDPQTSTEVLDRDVELLYAGASGGGESWATAAHLARIARACDGHPEQATLIAREAVKRSPLVAEAWRVLLRNVSPAEVEKTWQTLAKASVNFPDLAWEGLRLALERLLPDDKGRQKMYDSMYALAGAATRPDIQIQVRLAQIGELAAAKQDKEVIRLAFETVHANVKQGTLIMPMVKRVVELANGFKESDPSFRMNVVKETFAKLAADFPKQRGNEVSPAWTEWQQLVGSLK